MGWKSLVRSMEASMRRAEKAAQREEKRQAKLQQFHDARDTVKTQEEYIKRIISIHTECTAKKMDWEKIANQDAPLEPKRLNNHEAKAREKYNNFKPSIFLKFFRIENKRRKILWQSIEKATKKDEQEYQENLKQYHANYALWEKEHTIAQRLLQRDPKTYIDIIREMNPFREFEVLCSTIKFFISDDRNLTVNVVVHGNEVIPKEKYNLRQSGTLSIKEMPKSELNKLYQDYVCSCILRVAAELFSFLPIEKILINANNDLLNPSTGHVEEQTILSVVVMRETLENINLAQVDPSDAMENFIHNMKFKKTVGLEVVEPVVFS